MDIGLAVGGAFLSSGLQVLFDRLAPQGELLKMFQKGKRDHLKLFKKLETTLLCLQAVLSDAENKQASNSHVSRWLNKLQHAVDSAENLMEEVNYDVLRLKVEGQHQNLAETSNQWWRRVVNIKSSGQRQNLAETSNLNLCLSDEFFSSIKEKLEDTIETLEGLEKQIGRLGLKGYLDSGVQKTRDPSTSVVDESGIIGRDNEIKELVDRLLSLDAHGKKLTVIPILGMGGVGKTTLAKAVYNDEKVEDHFNLKAWICVSEAYDALRITKELLQEIGSFDSKADNNLNQLQVKLKESLKGKKFLIILDDFWNDNYNEWDDLRNLFVQGDEGSKVIVTTRKESVAKTMGSEPISVGILSDGDSWSFFKRHVVENMDLEEHPELEEIGKQIAAKCKGVPLALKTLAGMLRSKSEVEEWKYILRNETWELPSHPNGILPALMLSYNDLPTHLKQCFAYLAIFPKDYPFCKEQVIQLWIANGLIERLHKEETIEHSSNRCFHDLRSRSLLESVPDSTQRNTEKYLMHDLVNDLAHTASSKLCISLDDNEGSHISEQTRHLSYSMGYGDFEKLKPLDKLAQLRTLLPIDIRRFPFYFLSKRVLHNIFPRLTSLRALSFSGYAIKELPNLLFVKLKLLRFLDLSRTRINKLPDSVCVLYNLEVLLLSSCDSLEELPLQMERLNNLRHLDISDTTRLKMPLHLIRKLKSLQVLMGAEFRVGRSGVLKIRELGELHTLYGSLSILELQNVADRREALKANMREKKHVEKLSLEWSSESIADSSQDERDILDELQPNTNIKELKITGYRGTKFPDWLADARFHKLVKMTLSKCKDCDSLPALGQLPSLKELTIEDMLEWKQWDVLGNGEFPALQYLSIKNCPKLTGKLPENLCSLTCLIISKCPELILETTIQLSSVKTFNVVGSAEVGVLFYHTELFTSQLQGMKQIEELKLEDCHSLTSFPFSSLSNTLKRISMHRCGKLKLEPSVSEMISSGSRMLLSRCDSIDDISPELVPRVHDLGVDGCRGLTRLSIPTGTEEVDISNCENIGKLSVACGTGTQTMSLRHLSIHDCKKLKSLPEHMQELLPSLKYLKLEECPEIESFPEGGLPFSLEVLKIKYCEKLVNGRKDWQLQRLPCLGDLTIYHDGSDEEIHWELPASIQHLTIDNLKTLSSQVLKSLTSLEYLKTRNLPQFQSLVEEGIPSSLSELILYSHHELHSLPTEGLRHLTSLWSLEIYGCNQLQSIAESALPSSLSVLTISDCSNLQSLPVKGMPSSISELYIWECPLLKPHLEFEKGDYWPIIAHLPTIYIDREWL